MSTFPDAILKINRADKHIAELETAIQLMKDRNVPVVKKDPVFGFNSVYYGFNNSEVEVREFSCIAGDAIHNLRTALDFGWIAIFERKNIPYDRYHISFPVRETLEKLKSALNGTEVETICPALYDYIVNKVQPYSGGNDDIVWTLHNLDISDKHLLRLGFNADTRIENAVIRHKNGELETITTWATHKFGRYGFSFLPDDTLEDKGHVAFNIRIEEAGIHNSVEVVSMLSSFSKFIRGIIHQLQAI